MTNKTVHNHISGASTAASNTQATIVICLQLCEVSLLGCILYALCVFQYCFFDRSSISCAWDLLHIYHATVHAYINSSLNSQSYIVLLAQLALHFTRLICHNAFQMYNALY